MRIVMLNHNVAWRGGTFFRAYHFANQMVRRGHEVTLVTISAGRRFGLRQEMLDGLKVVYTPDWLWGRGRTGWDPWDTLRRLLYVNQGEGWDLVHAFDSRPAVIFPALWLQRRGVPLVLDWADWWGRGGTIEERNTGFLVKKLIGPIEAYLEEAFRTRAQGTTVISTALRQRAIELGVPAESIATIPQGSDVVNLYPLDRAQCRRSLGLAEEASIVGYLGALNSSDAELLFSTYDCLRRSRPECLLLMIGEHRASLPHTSGILETGYVTRKELRLYLGAADLMLLPLKDTVASRGRWPSKVNDYLSAGRAVVGSAVGDVRDLFDRHNIGRATADEPEILAQAAEALLSDSSLRHEMELNARRVAETLLAWPTLSGQLEAHYHFVLDRMKLN